MNEFISKVRQSIQLITFNRFRSSTVRAINKEIKISFFSLSSYFFEWSLSKAALRRDIERFNRNIVDYKAIFQNSRSRSFSSNFNSSMKSFVFKVKRFRSQSFVKISRERVFTFFLITFVFESDSQFSTSFSFFSTLNVDNRRFKSIFIFNIESVESQKHFTQSSSNHQSITRQFIIDFTNFISMNENMFSKKNNDYQSIDFSLRQWTTIRNFMSQFDSFDSFEFSNSQNTSTSQNVVNNDNFNRWNVDEIDFFDFNYDDKFVVIKEVMKHVDKNIYFRDVNDFINRVKNMINVKDVEFVRQNLYICFRETTMIWYIIVLIEKQKRFVKFDENVDEWVLVFRKRFKKFFFIVMIIIIKKRYIMKNARRKRKSLKYVHVITKTAKFTKMNIFFQICFIYNDINFEFRRDLSDSSKFHVIMNSFFVLINRKKKIWWNISRNERYDNVDEYNFDRFENNFRFQQDSYNSNRFDDESFSQKNYDNEQIDYEYASIDN